MKFTVKNFGPIREAKNIEIKPMTVFVGPSNTGKSYLAVLIYSIVKALGYKDYHLRLMEISMHYRIVTLSETGEPDLSAEDIEKYFLVWAQAVSKSWRREFVYCFGEEGRNILENGEKDGKLSITISDAKNQISLDLINPDGSQLAIQEKLKLHTQTYADLLSVFSKKSAMDEFDEDHFGYHATRRYSYHRVFVTQFSKTLLEEKGRRAAPHYIPAVRGGIMQSHRTLVSALIGLAPQAGLSEASPVPLFSGVLSDFMQKLINIENSRGFVVGEHIFQHHHDRGDIIPILKIGEDMEKVIMRGKIEVRKSQADYPDFRYLFEADEKQHDLPLMSASSMVSELAPVSLFIRNYVAQGDFFIVEEPESHLHPAAQRDISNTLAQLANAGVNVLITTHSDNVLEQIGNNVLASIVEGKVKGKFLEEGKVSAYLFNRPESNPHKKTKVKKIKFDDESGYLTDDHLNVSTALYNDSVRLLNKRQNNGN